jgi:deazaflavin-dependent oxidoreductase (nitroreductase family)
VCIPHEVALRGVGFVYGRAMLQRLLASFTHHAGRLPVVGSAFGRLHAALVRRTGGRVGGRWFGAPILTLVTIGRRSGAVRETALLYVKVGDDGLALLAANAGNERPPAWWLNLRAAETVEVVVRGERRVMRWREAVGEEHDELLERFVAVYPPAEHYARYTERVLPVAVLAPA